jgi:TonB family protein
MNNRKHEFLLAATLLLFVLCNHNAVAQEDNTVFDKKDIVRSFEKMQYPQLSRQARIEGVVVVRVKLDSVGKVISATAISGANLLIPDTLSNVQKWRFSPDAGTTAIIIYEFRIQENKCDTGKPKSLFAFREPNIAMVTGCIDEWQP